jgi:hypothetical protein
MPKKRTPGRLYNKIPAPVHGVIDQSVHVSVPLLSHLLAKISRLLPDFLRLYLLQDSVNLQPNFSPAGILPIGATEQYLNLSGRGPQWPEWM